MSYSSAAVRITGIAFGWTRFTSAFGSQVRKPKISVFTSPSLASFGRVVTDADRQIKMEGTYCDCVRRLQRIVHGRTEIISEVACEHAGLLLGAEAQYKVGPHHHLTSPDE